MSEFYSNEIFKNFLKLPEKNKVTLKFNPGDQVKWSHDSKTYIVAAPRIYKNKLLPCSCTGEIVYELFNQKTFRMPLMSALESELQLINCNVVNLMKFKNLSVQDLVSI